MATQLAPQLHPAIAASAALTAWTDHAAVKPLFVVLRDLQPIYDRLACLNLTARPFESNAATELGVLQIRYSTSPRFGVRPDRTLTASGVCGMIWNDLEQLRDEWINAKLTAEGLHPHIRAHDGQYHARWSELDDAAVSVAAAWGAFERGTL